MKAKIKNMEKIRRKFRMMHPVVKKHVTKEVLETAINMENFIVSSMRLSPSSGRTYGRHQASKAGQFPRIDKGDLVNAIETRQSKLKSTVATVGVHAGKYDRYGKSLSDRLFWLDRGTSKMDARPVFKPTIMKFEKNFVDGVNQAIKNAIREVSKK